MIYTQCGIVVLVPNYSQTRTVVVFGHCLTVGTVSIRVPVPATSRDPAAAAPTQDHCSQCLRLYVGAHLGCATTLQLLSNYDSYTVLWLPFGTRWLLTISAPIRATNLDLCDSVWLPPELRPLFTACLQFRCRGLHRGAEPNSFNPSTE